MNSIALPFRNRRFSVWNIFSILAAILSILLIYSYLSWLRAQIPVSGKLVSVIVAAHDIDPGVTIGPSDLTSDRQPQKFLPPLALTAISAAVGKVSVVPIHKGEPITARKVGSKGGLSSLVPAGMRAYSVRIDSGTSIGFLPAAGDLVDVVVTLGPEALGQPTALTVLRAREVATIGTTKDPTQSDRVNSKLKINSPEPGLSVTLFVTPDEAERLAMAEALGRITIILAPYGSANDEPPRPINPKDLMTS